MLKENFNSHVGCWRLPVMGQHRAGRPRRCDPGLYLLHRRLLLQSFQEYTLHHHIPHGRTHIRCRHHQPMTEHSSWTSMYESWSTSDILIADIVAGVESMETKISRPSTPSLLQTGVIWPYLQTLRTIEDILSSYVMFMIYTFSAQALTIHDVAASSKSSLLVRTIQ